MYNSIEQSRSHNELIKENFLLTFYVGFKMRKINSNSENMACVRTQDLYGALNEQFRTQVKAFTADSDIIVKNYGPGF